MRTVETIFRALRRGLDTVGLTRVAATSRPVYHRFLGLWYPAGVPRFIHGEPALFFSPEGRGVPEDKDRAGFLAMKGRVHEGAIVLDLGANVGMYTLLMARWAGLTGKVFAFEPAPATLTKLCEHVKLNQLADRVEVIGAAVGDAVGQVTFYTTGLSGHSSVAASGVGKGQSLVVPLTTVDAFCQSRGIVPTFVKIDVEGYEFHVLDGARETIQRCKPDLLIETHPRLWGELGLTRKQVMDRLERLKSLGYQEENLDSVADPLSTEAHLLYRLPSDAIT